MSPVRLGPEMNVIVGRTAGPLSRRILPARAIASRTSWTNRPAGRRITWTIGSEAASLAASS